MGVDLWQAGASRAGLAMASTSVQVGASDGSSGKLEDPLAPQDGADDEPVDALSASGTRTSLGLSVTGSESNPMVSQATFRGTLALAPSAVRRSTAPGTACSTA